jgi:hypothetical protein
MKKAKMQISAIYARISLRLRHVLVWRGTHPEYVCYRLQPSCWVGEMGKEFRTYAWGVFVSPDERLCPLQSYPCWYRSLPVPMGTVNHDGSAVMMRWKQMSTVMTFSGRRSW